MKLRILSFHNQEERPQLTEIIKKLVETVKIWKNYLRFSNYFSSN
jgi:hypothetical protein